MTVTLSNVSVPLKLVTARSKLAQAAAPRARDTGPTALRSPMPGKVVKVLVKAGGKFRSDNVYALELDNGSRVLALPSGDDTVRGLTVDAWIIADEAARLTDELIAALRPMRARRPHAWFAMLSTAWSRTDPFWKVWDGDDPSWIRLRATADADATLFKP